MCAILYKPRDGLEYNLSKDLSLQIGIGKVISKEGNLDANTLEDSLLWRFGTPKKRSYPWSNSGNKVEIIGLILN